MSAQRDEIYFTPYVREDVIKEEVPLQSSIWNQIRAFHRLQSPHEWGYDLIWGHCQVVALLAFLIAEKYYKATGIQVNVSLLVKGALLHDIGTYCLLKKTPQNPPFDRERYLLHGVYGYRLLKESPFSEVADFARFHTGVGITEKEIKERHLPLPDGNYCAQTTEEEIVMYADKFHSKSYPSRFVPFEEACARTAKFGVENTEKFLYFSQTYGIPDIDGVINFLHNKGSYAGR